MAEREPYFVIIRGPLGVGKSTVSERLARQLGGEIISIDRILDAHDLWEEGNVWEFLRANEIAAEMALRPLARGQPVIFDGNFYWEWQLEDLVGRLDHPHRVFTLEAPLRVCIERDRGREKPHGSQAARAVYAKSTVFESGIGIDAGGSPDSVVRKIMAHLPRTRAPADR
ncbi:MAG: ATP-binding protein [Thermoplasmata archaeon]|nr:ATP-binding protein [Thermoplasmata archaeon]